MTAFLNRQVVPTR